MPIRHMVLFSFRAETSGATRDRVLDGLAALPAHYPAMQRFGLGENASERDRTFTHVMTMEFSSFELLHGYLNSERHETFVRESFAPNVAARALASYETD